jgi:ubiquinone/menaquinone biosynthesis C-methylase UbiE
MVAPVPQPLSHEQIRDANARYHDLAADEYDSKWGIDFGELGRRQVTRKLRKALGRAPEWYPRSLEVGAGTGYFTLNMLRAGLIGEATCSDLSPGMLSTLQSNACRLGVEVRTEAGDAERLPFPDAAFDLVLGHAVLHHIPDLPRAFAEFRRVLAPGGTILFAGEPSRCGNRLASVPKRTAWAVAPLWRRAVGARSGQPLDGADSDASLEEVVDIHDFTPAELSRLAREAGFEAARVTGEELLANWFGWANRTLESSAEPNDVPWAWRLYAHRGYLILQELDRRLLESRLPAAIFYNLMLAARKRGRAAERT